MAKVMKKDAERLFAGSFYGANQAAAVFGFRPPDPPLPGYWKAKDYEMHAEAGDILICYPDHLPDLKPLTLEKMAHHALSKVTFRRPYLWEDQFTSVGEVVADWICNDLILMNGMPRPGWQFVSPHILPQTTFHDFVEQTDILIGDMERRLGHVLPPTLVRANETWQMYEKIMAQRMIENGKLKTASFFLASCDITRLLREPVYNTFYRYLIVGRYSGERLFDRKWSWSSSPSSGGNIMFFGRMDEEGACILERRPDDARLCLGAVTSRMGF